MNATQMWAKIFFDVVSYETQHLKDGELLSQSADRLIHKFPVSGRIFILSTGAIITLHLANVLDEKFDLMSNAFWNRLLRKAGKVDR